MITTSLTLDAHSALSYAIALLVPLLDAIVPVLPSEAAIVALGVATARSTDPLVVLLVVVAAAGACVGDNVSYLIGRRLGPRVERRLLSGGKGLARRAWAERELNRYGMRLIVVCRFIPGGRTAVTLVCGLTGYPHRRFAASTVVAGLIWATYAFLIGRLGGRAFADQPWLGLAMALVVALGATLAIEIGRRALSWARSRPRRKAPA